MLLDCRPAAPRRVLDIGCGGGRLLDLVKLARPEAEAVALDFSPAMLEQLSQRFGADPSVEIVRHDLENPLPALGTFDAAVSSFAIHHLTHARKRSLYGEIFGLLRPGGVFCNLEHVASPTPVRHAEFLAALGLAPGEEDPSNRLVPAEVQVGWLTEIGFADADVLWRWREMALLDAVRPG